MFGCFSVMSHTRTTAEDFANMSLDRCTDSEISCEDEQKHESSEDVVVPAIVSPHQLSRSSDEEDSSNEVDACTRISHGVLAASSIVYDRNRTTWKHSSLSLVVRTSRQNSFTATTTVPTRISKNIGSRLPYLQCMETLHARINSSLSCQIHQRRILQRRREWLWLEHVWARVVRCSSVCQRIHLLRFLYKETYRHSDIFRKYVAC